MSQFELFKVVSAINVNITLTDILAVWGAFIASFVLLWDIYKWKTSGPRIHIDVKTNMCLYGDPAVPKNEEHVMCTVINRGDRPTTINILGVYSYKNKLKKLLRKTEAKGIIVNPGSFSGKPLPYVLEPGKEWTGLGKQKNLVEIGGKNEIYEIVVYMSHKNKPTQKAFRIEKK